MESFVLFCVFLLFFHCFVAVVDLQILCVGVSGGGSAFPTEILACGFAF